MKFILKPLIYCIWGVVFAALVGIAKAWAILNVSILFIAGVIWRFKPFKSPIPLTFKHLWNVDSTYCGHPLAYYFIDKNKLEIKQFQYNELFFFWR